MKITITYKTSQQISPDDFETYTKVIHLDENDILKNVHEKITKDWTDKNFDGEIHFQVDGKNK